MTFQEWRKQNQPSLRRSRPVGIIHAGQKKTVLGCLCSETHSYAAQWPKAKHAIEWEEIHNSQCMPKGVR